MTHEYAFEKQGCHLGSGASSFPNEPERAAWEVEGCLTACWLALSDDVERVEYWPGQESYLVKRDGVEGCAGEGFEGCVGEPFDGCC